MSTYAPPNTIRIEKTDHPFHYKVYINGMDVSQSVLGLSFSVAGGDQPRVTIDFGNIQLDVAEPKKAQAEL